MDLHLDCWMQPVPTANLFADFQVPTGKQTFRAWLLFFLILNDDWLIRLANYNCNTNAFEWQGRVLCAEEAHAQAL